MFEYREAIRHRITAQGHYRTGSGLQKDASIIDLSETGCRLFDPRSRLLNEQPITLRIDSLGPFDAKVVWVEDALFGVRFEKALYGPVFDHIVNALDSPEWRPREATCAETNFAHVQRWPIAAQMRTS